MEVFWINQKVTSGKTSATLYYFGHSIEITCNDKFDRKGPLWSIVMIFLHPWPWNQNGHILGLTDLRHLKEYAFKQPRFWGPPGKKKEDCENEITQNTFLWEEGEKELSSHWVRITCRA